MAHPHNRNTFLQIDQLYKCTIYFVTIYKSYAQSQTDSAARRGTGLENIFYVGHKKGLNAHQARHLFARLGKIQSLLFADPPSTQILAYTLRGDAIVRALAELPNVVRRLDMRSQILVRFLEQLRSPNAKDQIFVWSTHESLPESQWRALAASKAAPFSRMDWLRFWWARTFRDLPKGSVRDVYIDHLAYFDSGADEPVWLMMIRPYRDIQHVEGSSGSSGDRHQLEDLADLAFGDPLLAPSPIPIPVPASDQRQRR
jgi:hypothetical protein